MASAHIELDFLGLHQRDDSSSLEPALPPRPILDRRRSFCGISKINPEIVKSVIASAAAKADSSLPSPATLPDLPIFKPLPFSGGSNNEYDKAQETAPLTIIYQGTVSVFDLPKDKAEDVMKFAMDQSASKTESLVEESSFNAQNENNILGELNDGDLPIKRKKSLQRFFEKRKERLISVSSYPGQNHRVAQIYPMKSHV